MAAKHGHVTTITNLVRMGAHVDSIVSPQELSSKLPIALAVENGMEEAALELFRLGSLRDKQSSHHLRVIFETAVARNQIRLVRVLIDSEIYSNTKRYMDTRVSMMITVH
jgi:hypothetical protein